MQMRIYIHIHIQEDIMKQLYHDTKRTGSKAPFRLVGGAQPLIVVPAVIERRLICDFIVDTGAGVTLIVPEIAEELRLEIVNSREGRGAAGSVALEMAKVKSIEAAGVDEWNLTVGVTSDIHRISRAVDYPIRGVLGFDFLGGHSLSIDYESCELELDSESHCKDAEATMFRLAAPGKPLILVPVTINGRGEFQFAVDTGASITTVSQEAASSLGINAEFAIPPITGGGGTVGGHAVTLDSVQLGSRCCRGLSTVIVGFLSNLSSAVGERIDGILGYNFLRSFRSVLIHYPESFISLGEQEKSK